MQAEYSPQEHALGQAQSALAEAIERTRLAGKAYFDAPLSRSTDARERYYDALSRQWEAESAFYEAKRGVTAPGLGLRTP